MSHPGHVYQAVSDLISEIEILREAMGVTIYPVEAEPQEDRAPIHVYSKSLEVLEKISAAQRRLGMSPAKIGQIPGQGNQTERRLQERADQYRGAAQDEGSARDRGTRLDPPPSKAGRPPRWSTSTSGTLRSFWTDWSAIPRTRTTSTRIIVFLHEEMELIAAKLKVALELDAPVVEGRKRMREVAQQVFAGNIQGDQPADAVGHGCVGRFRK